MNRIRVSVSSSSGTGVFVEGAYVAIGDTLDLNVTIPLVTGGGDQSTNDPRTSAGTATITPECHNKTAIFTVEARIEWNVTKRQHVVYGLVRECYEIGTPCSAVCSGNPAPDTIYLTISNLSVTGEDSGQLAYPSVSFIDSMKTFLNATFALDRVPNLCDSWIGIADGGECAAANNPNIGTPNSTVIRASKTGFIVGVSFGRGNSCRYTAVFSADIPTIDQEPICGGFTYSGTGNTIYTLMAGDGPTKTFIGSFDYTLAE
jgi:hypothetical protein